MTLRYPYALWGQIPSGWDELSFEDAGDVVWRQQRWLCMCCSSNRLGMTERRFTRKMTILVSPSKQPARCSLWVRDILASFVMAFLFHLIPSIIWGAERSLGTPTNHQTMGAVWFLGWPLFGCLLLGATFQKKGIIIEELHSEDLIPRRHFVQLTHFKGDLHKHVSRATERHLGLASEEQSHENAIRGLLELHGGGISKWRAATVGGCLFWIILWVNGVVTGIVVQNCMASGCCLDNETTYDSCTTTGEPN